MSRDHRDRLQIDSLLSQLRDHCPPSGVGACSGDASFDVELLQKPRHGSRSHVTALLACEEREVKIPGSVLLVILLQDAAELWRREEDVSSLGTLRVSGLQMDDLPYLTFASEEVDPPQRRQFFCTESRADRQNERGKGPLSEPRPGASHCRYGSNLVGVKYSCSPRRTRGASTLALQ